ncbi:MAG: PH domain-containing protein [Aeromicrobium erythreum]
MITYRPVGTRLVAYGGALALVVMAVAITVALPADIRAQVTPSQALTLLGTLAAMVLVLHGIGRSCVRVDDDGIEVLNGFRRHRHAWTDVAGVAYPEGAPWPILVLKDDEQRVMLFGIQRSGGIASSRAAVMDIAHRVDSAAR